MKIAIIGSGGREHALVHHLSNSKRITKIYSIPGNAGTEEKSLNIAKYGRTSVTLLRKPHHIITFSTPPYPLF